MTIQEAQEYSRKHGITQISVTELRLDDVVHKTFTDNAWESLYIIEKALCNGYQLCKVDEAIEKIQNNNIADFIATQSCIDIVKEACK